MTKIAVVTGASSGIGRQTALALVKQGYRVIGVARHIADDLKLIDAGVDVHNLDVTQHEQVANFAEEILNKYKQVDLLVNSAGYGLFGAMVEVPLDDARRQLEVNVFGIMDLIQSFAPSMIQRKSGRIVNVSSLAGQSYSALAGWYYVSKHALETMSDVLRLELKPFNVDVVIVEPGITKTNWANVTNDKMLEVTAKDSPYRPMAEKQAAMITQATQSADDVAKVILKAASVEKPCDRYQVRFSEMLAMKLVHFASYRMQDRLANRMMK